MTKSNLALYSKASNGIKNSLKAKILHGYKGHIYMHYIYDRSDHVPFLFPKLGQNVSKNLDFDI